MDGDNNGKPYEQMDDLGVFTPLFLETPIYDRETVQLFHNQQICRSVPTKNNPPRVLPNFPNLSQPALQKLETTYILWIFQPISVLKLVNPSGIEELTPCKKKYVFFITTVDG